MSTADVVAQRSNALPAVAGAGAAANVLTSISISPAQALLDSAKATIASTTTTTTTAAAAAALQSSQISAGIKRLRNGDHKDGPASKIRQRSLTETMEPPVLSFYGEQPVPLPSRFGHLKRRLVKGHEDAIEASWKRLIVALRDEVKHIEQRGTDLIPSIEFSHIEDSEQVASFRDSLKRYGIGVIRGVVDEKDAKAWVDETKKYLETKHEFKPPPAQDPTCYDFFWTPCQVRARAHPKVLHAQKFAMSMWETSDDDRLASRFPICYADRIRIDTNTTGELGATATNGSADASLPSTTSSTLIAQVDNGSLERWELDGYGRSGCYDSIWKGDWESYNPWDPTGRINATFDLYNGAGVCSIFRMFQGILALTTVEPGMVRLLPSPKLSTAYFLLRPFVSPKKGHPEKLDDQAAWEEYLDPDNWSIDKDQTTIIHGAVPGHAQRVTENWHPHLDLRNSMVAPPTLNPGDYIVWHPDEAYAFERTPPSTSMLVYTPAVPLTQTTALFLARQRKAFLRGHPGPDFDSTGSGLGSEAPHTGRLEEKDIADVGGEEGLQAMGLAPWNVGKTASKRATPTGDERDTDMDSTSDNSGSSISAAEAEVVRLTNIILFPDRYDFWMPSRTGTPSIDGAKGKDKASSA